MTEQKRYLVFGATGQTGRHFVDLVLADGHAVRAVARTPSKLPTHPELEAVRGSITEPLDLEPLLNGVDAVVVMLGDAAAQSHRPINTEFMRRLIPAMRTAGVTRLLYQAGGLSGRPDHRLNPILWAIRATIARGYLGQHHDNEAVMRLLTAEARDIDWVVHRAGIGSDGPSKGRLHRSVHRTSIATFGDCAAYSYRLLSDDAAIHTCDTSAYGRQ